MTIEHVLAVVPVADFDASHAWYENFLGRPAERSPSRIASHRQRVVAGHHRPGACQLLADELRRR